MNASASPAPKLQNHMVMIAHFRVGTNINSVNIRQESKAGNNPLLAMIIAISRRKILPPQIRQPYTPHIAVIERRFIEADLGLPAFGHGC